MTERGRRLHGAVAAELVLAREPMTTEQLAQALVLNPRTISARDGALVVTAPEVVAALAQMLADGTVVRVVCGTGDPAWALRGHVPPRRSLVPRPRRIAP